MRRALWVGITGLFFLQAGAERTSAQADALSFFKNYFITGDYVVGGVGLTGQGVGGIATGSIAVEGVPPGSDIAAAFLYWQVVSNKSLGSDAGSVGVKFKGHALSSADGPFGKVLGAATPPCWSSGGGTGSSNGTHSTYSYRADVLRYFDIDGNTGKLAVNGSHEVQLPDGQGRDALGASLVVIYRDPTAPLGAIVLYDGAYTMDQSTEGMSQTIQGFYDAGTAAKLTHIVGSGQPNKSENLRYNGTAIATNPFRSALGAQWDNPTFELTANPALRQVTTSVDHAGFNSFDCLTWAAIVYRTTVKDFDSDGLLDLWESSTAPILDPHGRALPALNAMGADPLVKDLFVEVGYLKTDIDTTYGNVSKSAHSHRPTHEALKLVGDTFANAPTGRINVHIDVGNSYPPGDAGDPAKNAEAYIIRGPGARGGEAIDESATVCTRGPADPPWVCQFSEYPGTVGWKAGYRFLRDEVLSGPTPAPGQDDPCEAPGNTCERRFDRNRNDMFHYALFAHAVGLPKAELPCLDAGNNPVPDVDDQCVVAENPDFHEPRTNTGIGDFPGGDLMVTLGAFIDVDGKPVGTPFMQASTLMHEFGHNAERRHGGDALEPNCKPTYLSVMNYLYQLRGLPDDFGRPHLDFSREIITPAIGETSLADASLNNLPYRIGWYAPLEGSYLDGRGRAATKHCDGSARLPSEPEMVRIDARTAAGAIDWNADGDLADTNPFSQDVNFNGRLDGSTIPALGGAEDWSNIRLNQIGSRRNVGGAFAMPGNPTVFAVGPLSLDVGKGDLGKGDLGKGDLGKGDLGKGDLGKGDLGKGDLGKGDLGKGDLGKGDLGGGDLFVGDPNNPGGELDFETAGGLAKTPPNQFGACVIGVDCPGTSSPLHRVRLDWTMPTIGGVSSYSLYRVPGDTLVPQQQWTQVGQVASVLGQIDYSAIDGDQLLNGASYTYFAVAMYADGIQSDPSNIVTITAVNDPPVAEDDLYSGTEDTTTNEAAPGVLVNDTDVDTDSSLTAVIVTDPSHGLLVLNADGSFAYTPVANYNGPDSFTYKANDGVVDTNTATVTIVVHGVNDNPVANADSVSVAEDSGANAIAVLGNDNIGPDTGETLTVASVTQGAHGGVTFTATGVSYTPAADYNGPDSFTYTIADGNGGSAAATVSVTVTSVNDAPTISDMADRTIDANSNTVVPFVIGDDALAGVTVTGGSGNTTLVPSAGLVFTGSGANRTLTVTPAPNQSGAATITVTATDSGGLTASDSFVLTVRQVSYTLFGVQNVPPPSGKTFKAGSAVPMKWQFKNGSTVVDSSQVAHMVTVRGPLPSGPIRNITNTDPGSSSFRYEAANKTWQFNLQTKEPNGQSYPVGLYEVTITPTTPGFLPSQVFQMKLVK